MKKITTILCLLVMMFSIHINVYATTEKDTTLTIGNVETEAGATVSVPIDIANNKGILAAVVTISYDEGLVLKGITNGPAFSSLTFTRPGDISANPFNLVWDGVEADSSNGTIATLEFEVPEKTGTYQIKACCEEGNLIDNDLASVECGIVNGSIVVKGSVQAEDKIEKITLSKETLELQEGATSKLTYTVFPQTDKDLSERCVWTSDNERVATVNNGVITAVSAGDTIIRLTIDGVSASCQVNVVKNSDDSFEITDVASKAYNKLTITWPEYEGADGYIVYKLESTGKYSTLKTITDRAVTSYIHTVTSGVKYTYKVAAYQLSGEKKKIIVQTKEKSGTALPAAPTVTGANMAAYNKIRIQWTKVNGCEGYVIYRNTSEDGKYVVLKTVTQASATEYVNVVTSSEDYYYKIRAFVTVDGKKVYGDYSNILKGNVISGPPANFNAVQVKDTKIMFTWDRVEDVDGYVIYMSSEVDGTYKAIKNITSKDTLVYNKVVTAGEKYYFYMKSYRNIDGKKVYSQPTRVLSNN